jgi:hypothetical protein
MLYLVVIWSLLLLLLLMIDDVSPTAMLTLSMKNKGSIKYKSSKLICNFFKEILYVLVSFLTDEVVAPYGPRLSPAGVTVNGRATPALPSDAPFRLFLFEAR